MWTRKQPVVIQTPAGGDVEQGAPNPGSISTDSAEGDTVAPETTEHGPPVTMTIAVHEETSGNDAASVMTRRHGSRSAEMVEVRLFRMT